jgi:hybrid cluster-associated redox disulfide protein
MKSEVITKNTLISEIVQKWPDLAQVLVEDYGFHCIGCFASEMETIEQGAAVHGMGEDEIEVMIETLNELRQENLNVEEK